MSSDSPAVILYDANGVAQAVADGVAIPANTHGLLIAGTDGTNARVPKVTSARRLVVDGSEVTQPVALYDNVHGKQPQWSAFGALKTAPESILANYRFDAVSVPTDFNVTTTGSAGYVIPAGGTGVQLNSGAAIGKITLSAKSNTIYQSGRGLIVKQSVITGDAGTVGNIREWGRATTTNGTFLRLDGTTLSWVIRRDSVETVIPSNTWNVPVTHNGNGHLWYQQMEWLGVGNIYLYYDEQLVHTYAFIGTSTEFSVGTPDLPVWYRNENVTNTTNVYLKSGCAAVGVEGGEYTIRVGQAPDALDNASLTKSVITGVTTAGGGGYVDVKVAPSGAVQVGGDVGVTDGTNIAAVKAASTQAVATDPSLVVQISPNQASLTTMPKDYLLDAFARLRVSSPITLFDGKSLYGNRVIDYDEAFVGGGSAADLANNPIRRLTISTGATDSATRQTKRYFAYQAGKSHQVLCTFTFGAAVANVRRRVGYFDNANGLFLQQTSTAISVVKRSSTTGAVVDTVVNQASWNIDPLNGTGPSGLTLDLADAQILYIDMEWLGVGIARLGFVIGGVVYYAHAFKHANVSPGVYMQTAALPVRWELAATAASAGATLDCNCASVASEGGNDYPGILTSIDNGTTPIAFATGDGTNLRPLLSVRAQTAYTRMTAFPEKVEAYCSTNSAAGFRWALLLNPTVTGGAAAAWTAITNSGLEFDRARTGVLSGGYQVASGYGFGSVVSALIQRNLSIGATIAGVRDEYVLGVQQLSGANESYVGVLQMREVF